MAHPLYVCFYCQMKVAGSACFQRTFHLWNVNGQKKKHVLKRSLGVPCVEVKIDAFPPSSDCEANDGQMLESSWEWLRV